MAASTPSDQRQAAIQATTRASWPAAGCVTLHYPGETRQVILQDAPEVMSGLAATLRGWTPVSSSSPPADTLNTVNTLTSVIGGDRGFSIGSVFLEEPMSGLPAASAVCGVIADLAQSFFEGRPGCMALHCGAVRIGGRLIAFTGSARAGKSTLMARLTAEPDLEVFCDDVLPVLDDGLAFGLGIAPRLRLPLPERSSAMFRTHVANHSGPQDEKYAYVCAPTVAPHGTRAPLSAFVLLARDAGSTAQLHRMRRSEAVRHLLAQNMADPGDGAANFERVSSMAESLLCLKLVYCDLEDAVALIRAAFGDTTLPSASVRIHDISEHEASDCASVAAPLADLGLAWRRQDHVTLRRVENEMFLWKPADNSFFHLNQTAAAVWTLLETPQSGDDLVEVLADIYQDVATDHIAQGIGELLGAMLAEDLISDNS